MYKRMDTETGLEYSNLLVEGKVKEDVVTYQNVCQLTTKLIVVGLSAFYFGYCLTYFSTFSTATCQQVYKFTISTSFNGILIGVLPVGAILGAGTGPLLMRVLTRKQFLLVINLVALVVEGVIQYPNIYVLLVCRILQGFFIGNYMAIVPIYINELAPKQIVGSFGVFTQLLVVFALVISYALGLIFTAAGVGPFAFFRLMVGLNAVFIILQSILLLINYVPESPNSLIAKNKNDQAREVIGQFTLPEYIDAAFREKKAEVETELHSQQNKSSSEVKINYSFKAFLLGFQLPFMQQLTGVNAIVTQAGKICENIIPNIANYIPIIINVVQLIATICTVFVLTRIGRRPLVLFGNLGLAIIDIIIGILFVITWSGSGIFVLVMLILYMIVYGISLGPVVWLYVPEIIPAKIVPLATMMNWFGCSLCVIFTPMAIEANGGNPFPVFFFFGAITFLFWLLNFWLMVETKDCTGEEIANRFLKQA